MGKHPSRVALAHSAPSFAIDLPSTLTVLHDAIPVKPTAGVCHASIVGFRNLSPARPSAGASSHPGFRNGADPLSGRAPERPLGPRRKPPLPPSAAANVIG